MENVSFTYPHQENPLLKRINLEINKGEVILLAGPSGSGKSTLSRLFNALSPHHVEGELTGEISVFGLNPQVDPIEDFVPLVGSVFQNPKTQHFTAETTSELAFPLENMGVNPPRILEIIAEVSDLLKIENLLDRNIYELSGGEKQQLSFATAVVLNPHLLVLDEVTSNLDHEAIARLTEMVRKLKATGITIVLVEHRLFWIKDIVDRVYYINDGSIVEEWDNREFCALSDEELHTKGLRSLDMMQYQQIISEKKFGVNTDEGALKTLSLNTGYGRNKVISQNLSLNFPKGQVTALLGSNGQGKSTLAQTLTGLIEPLAGEILFENKNQTSEELLAKTFLVMQDTNYQLFSHSVESEVSLGSVNKEHLDDILDALNLLELKDRHPMSLSGGEKQRVAIASAILSDKEIIIFDEPTSGLDFINMDRFGNLIAQLKKLDKVIIVITHDLELAALWCDQIMSL